MSYLMGIDLGSTSLKAVIYDKQGHVIAEASNPTQQFHPNPEQPDWTVWQPEQIWGGIADAIKQAISKIDDASSIKAVAVTGMGMDGVPMDEEGNCLYPFISWHDPRTQAQHDWWKANIGMEKTFSIGGNVLWRFNTALRLLWMREHEPEILNSTYKWVLIEDFVNYRLCGKFATDYTMAACTLLFDQKTLTWSDEICELSGIDSGLMCEPHPSGTVLGEVTTDAAMQTGLAEGTPVVLGGHDYLCAALPVGGFRDGVVLDITGTWEIVQVAVQEAILTSELQRAGMTVEAHAASKKYAIWGGATAAEMTEWYAQNYGFEARLLAAQNDGSHWDYLMAEAEQSPVGARGAMFLPHLSGAGSPIMDVSSLGAYVGISKHVTRADMLRALIEGLDYQFLDIVNTFEKELNIQADKIIAVGGAVKNSFWMQNKADVTGRVIEVPAVEEATALGAAILAGIGVGLYKDEMDAFEQVYRQGQTYTPNTENHKHYRKLFPIYSQLYSALKDVNQQIYNLTV